MKRFKFIITFLLVCALTSVCFVGCGEPNEAKGSIFTIKYVLNQGELDAGKENPLSYVCGETKVTINNPKRTGYVFIGWTGTGLKGLTMDLKIDKDTIGDKIFTANFAELTVTILYDLNGFTYNGLSEVPCRTIRSGEILVAEEILLALKIPPENDNSFERWTINEKTITTMADLWKVVEDEGLTVVTLKAEKKVAWTKPY